MNTLPSSIPVAAALLLLMASLATMDAQTPSAPAAESPQPAVLQPAAFKHFVDAFNQNDTELYPSFISNANAWDFLKNNIPLFDCPDQDINEIYYFRWWTFRKH